MGFSKAIEVQGDPQIGIITHFKQIHRTSAPNDRYSRLKIILSQEKILRDLIREEYTVVAKEGNSETMPPGHPNRDFYCYTEKVKKLFPTRTVSSMLSAQQKQLIYELGAVKIYAGMRPEVTVLRTTTDEKESAIDKIIYNQTTSEEEKIRHIFQIREHLAMEQMMEYLTQHPGSKIAVIYGADHHFGIEDLPDSIKDSCKRPLVVSISYPEVEKRFPHFAFFKVDSQTQCQLVREATLISWTTFGDCTLPESQKGALSKLSGQYMSFEKAKDFKEYLLDCAVDSEVKDLIQMHFQKRSGPFREYQCRKNISWKWKDLPSMHDDSVGILISDEIDPRTQYELVHRARKVSYLDFSYLKTESSQGEALDKLQFVPGTYPAETKDELKKYLLDDAINNSIKEYIEYLYLEEHGPFDKNIWS